MTPQQILDAISASPALTALAAPGVRNDAEIARVLSINRTKLRKLEITERGVRAALGDVEGARFMRVMKALRDAANTDTVPAWLTAILSAMQRALDTHVLTLDTMGIAFDWLKKDPGLDIGDEQTQGLMDIIAAGYQAIDAKIPVACVAIKKLARVDDPVSVNAVSDALNPLMPIPEIQELVATFGEAEEGGVK